MAFQRTKLEGDGTEWWTPPPLTTDRLILAAPKTDGPDTPNASVGAALSLSAPPRNWTLLLKPDGTPIGSIGFIRFDPAIRLGEIGFILRHTYRGCGYMREACRAVIGFGFGALKLETIEGRSLPRNLPSIRLLESVGMQRRERVQARLFSKGGLVDLDIYRIDRRDWTAPA